MKGKAQKSAPNRPSIALAQVQDKTKRTRESNPKTIQELKPSSYSVKEEEKTTISKTKNKRNPPELSNDIFKKIQTHRSMHMLASLQVFHPLGKKNEKKTGISSFQAMLNFKVSAAVNIPGQPNIVSLLDVPHDGRGHEKIKDNNQRPEISAHKEHQYLSHYELPPPR
ncbi:hypothetical protein U0070_009508 [Myodes glareolus]|uniref:DUF4629 domain-containing protein n=1 Tax=Myodes glareolus TaxID=447135 RepID=A0AAW0H3F2_MYOGA